MKKIIITGATGMIGSSIARCALEKNIEVLCKDSNRLSNLPKSEKLKIIFASQDEYSHLEIPDEFDVFYHLAWDKTFGVSRDDVDVQVRNIQYTLDSVRLAKRLGCKKFIGAGSQAEYGIICIVTMLPGHCNLARRSIILTNLCICVRIFRN